MTKTALKEFIRRSANHEILVGSHGRWTVILDSQGTMAIVTLDDSLPQEMEKLGAVRGEKDIAAVAKKVVTDIADHKGGQVLSWMEIHKGSDSRVLLLARDETDTRVSVLNPTKWEIFCRADLIYTEGGNKPILFQYLNGSYGYVLPIRFAANDGFQEILRDAAAAWRV